MSEVKRYARMGDLVESTPGLLKLYPAMTVYVLGYDFDRVTAERDAALGREAALREELKTSRAAFKEELDGVKYTRRRFRQERDQLQQRLTAADERADALEGLLREIRQSCELSKLRDAQIDAALKPAEAHCNIPACDYQIDMDQN